MEVKDCKSSYVFKPKAPDNWATKQYKRSDRIITKIALKRWQTEAHLRLRDAACGFLKAFCGSGKTIAARSIAAYKVYKHNKTQVFVVPKNDIGNDGFAGFCDLEIPFGKNKKVLSCDTPTNFCDFKTVAGAKTDELIDLMLASYKDDDAKTENQILSARQIVCTHQCLVLAFRKIKEKAKKDPSILKKFIANKTFWIDEGHHIKGYETKEDKELMNLLGRFVHFILDNKKDTNTELFVMTATPYRGDYSNLFHPEEMDNFELYSLDFLDHFPTLGIKNVDIEFEEYSKQEDVFEKVASNIAKEINNKHFVFVPPTGRKWRKKREDVDKLFNAIYRCIMKTKNVTFEVAKSMVLDLVTEHTQDFNDKLLRQEPKSGQTHKSKYTVVVCCMKCREGSDWCPADRLHNTSMETSPPLNFQTNGRLFRHFPGKDSVKITYYVEKFKSLSKSKREFVSDRLNAMLMYMLMDDLLNPIMVDIPSFIPNAKSPKNPIKRKYTTLEDIFHPNYQNAKKFLLKTMEEVVDFNENNIESAINKTINKFLPSKDTYTKKQINEVKFALKTFLLRTRSGFLRRKGIDISYVRKNGFDKIVEKHSLHKNLYTCSLDQKDLKNFRDTIKELSWTSEQTAQIAEGIRKEVVKESGVDIDSRNLKGEWILKTKEQANIFFRIKNELELFHENYKNLSKNNRLSVVSMAKSLMLPKEYVQKRINDFNKFMPKGYEFFKSDSKLANKVFLERKAA